MNMVRKAGLVLVAALAIGACGSDDEKGGGGDALSKSELAKEANRICAAQQEKASAVKAPDSLEDAEVAAKYFNQVAPILQEESDQLAELTPADDVKADWDEFVAAEKDANDLIQTITKKANDKDASGIQDLQQLQPVTQKVSEAASAVGATACAA